MRAVAGGTGAQLTFLRPRLGEPGCRPRLEQAGPGHFLAEDD
jgi:hypothetical protein